jgi:cupredoxin-like protein
LVLLLGVALILAGLFVLLRPNAPATGPQTQEFDLRISAEAMEPSDITVNEGDRVVLRITADSPLEVHVHGYDVEREVEPGEPTELSFRADLTGRFEIENHETEEELGTLVVRPR